MTVGERTIESCPPADGGRFLTAAPGRRLLLVGAGPSQLAAIGCAQAAGLVVVAADADETAPGLALADVAAVADSADALAEVARRERVSGVFTIAAERLVPVVATIAERVGLPGIGTDVAAMMTNKQLLRARLRAAGVAQPPSIVVRSLPEARAAATELAGSLVVKPVDMSGQRGVALVRDRDELEDAVVRALAASPSRTLLVERFAAGPELNVLAVVRAGQATIVGISDRFRPDDGGFGVSFAHKHPTTVAPSAIDAAATVTQASDHRGRPPRWDRLRPGDRRRPRLHHADRAGSAGPRRTAGRAAAHRHRQRPAHIAIHQALGEAIADSQITPSHNQPAAIRFLTASPGHLRPGRVTTVHGVDQMLSAPGVVAGESFLRPGVQIHPARVDADRHAWVLAVGDSADHALTRADAAARLLNVDVDT